MLRPYAGIAAVLLAAVLLSACGGHRREAQNRNDVNILQYRESLTVHDEERLTGAAKPELSRRVAEILTTMEGIHTAHVLLSGNQAFVAVTLRDGNGTEVRKSAGLGGSVSQYLKGSISDKIRSMDPDIRHVYVTDRTEFVQRFEAINTDMSAGRSAEGLIRELSEAVSRFIPNWTVGNNPPPVTP